MNSLTLRVSLIAALVVAVFAVVTALALDRAFRDSAVYAVEERLQAQLFLLMGAAEVDPAGRVSLPERLPESRLMLPDSGLHARVGDDLGRTLWRSPSALGTYGLQPDDRAFVARMTVDWETPGGVVPLTFTLSEDRSGLEAQLRTYRRSLWGWLAVLAVLLLAAQSLALYLGLIPLRRVARELRAMEQGEQSALTGRYPVELKALTDNLNDLLRQERAQLARYRDGLADLAHSLKTPLAVLRGSLESRHDEDRRHDLEQLERMDRIVAYQLQRAATAGHRALAAPMAVASLVQRLGRTLDKVYPDKGVVFFDDVSADSRFRGNEGDLMELLGNLMDNAWKYGRSRVRVSSATEGRWLVLRVEDDGPGIPADQVPAILARGGRLDEGVPGQGIGLAVVNEIVSAYEGRLTIGTSEALGGARVEIRLPG
ncbi:ATP-binding protein [Ectothiorhodospira lacustris]|uniref:ATP-binding protein n=1 Tax=Ectothiorhodospira lacustris TaxID=2899127 RepID=UPI001EE811BC|nr:ATP-binding protein [Ectothiorhodospira lacustris]MCG5499342.1 ATP-binding protein [Ectothiorhodospira lacustris]MCG5509231.1 ATP-binding protein [Ectothiorhodospira lacustris]MCG5521021.1 ATP-binding protein [Ectothiorhodospira lacustris]